MTFPFASFRTPHFSLTQTGKITRHSTRTMHNLDNFVSAIYLPHIHLRKRSWNVDERIARQYLSPAFGERQFTSITSHNVEIWLHGLAASGLSPATCNRILSVFKTICALAIRLGILPAGQSPCTGVSPFTIHTQRERYLTQEEALRLMRKLEASDRPEAFALRLLLLTGARKSEILKARWEHIDIEHRLLTVPLSKSGKPRHIPLSDEAVEVLRAIPHVPGCQWVFPGRAPEKPRSDLYLFWNRLRRQLGLTDVRIHDLRHSFASFLVNAGHSLYEVQTLLGHHDPRTTMRYAHLGQASLVAAAQTVGICVIQRKGRSETIIPPALAQGKRAKRSTSPTHMGRRDFARHKQKKDKKNEATKWWRMCRTTTPASACVCPQHREFIDSHSVSEILITLLKILNISNIRFTGKRIPFFRKNKKIL